jgi:YaaC-like protein
MLQGRLFFEIAQASPLQIRPLQIYYGVVGFAKAVVLAIKVAQVDTLVQSHGLSDITAQNSKIEDLAVKVLQAGTFQEFNNVVAPLGRFSFYVAQKTEWIAKPFDSADKLADRKIAIRDIFARIPDLQELYEKTFRAPSQTCLINLNHNSGFIELRIDDPEHFTSRESLTGLVKKWRGRFRFLEKWRFLRAVIAWDNSILWFCNAAKEGIDEFSEEHLSERHGEFHAEPESEIHRATRLDLRDLVPPLSEQSPKTMPYAIEPYNGVHLSEEALWFLASYLLSTLVRYRPQIWQHAISRSFSADAPADDRCLALVEKLLDVVLSGFPSMVVNRISQR